VYIQRAASDGDEEEVNVILRPDDHRTFNNLIRSLRDCADRRGPMVRIGADLEVENAEHVDLVAARLANCNAAHDMQQAYGASVIVVVSASFHTHIKESDRYFPASRAYAQFPEDAPDGPTCWIALPDRTVCPKMPKQKHGYGPKSNAHLPPTASAERDVNIVYQYGPGSTFHHGDNYYGRR
jgi:hypothetical protein